MSQEFGFRVVSRGCASVDARSCGWEKYELSGTAESDRRTVGSAAG